MRRLIILIKNILCMPRRLFTNIALFCILQDTIIDKTAAVCSGVRFYRGRIGRYSYIGNNSFVIDTDIGNFVSISENCYIGGTSHPLDWVSTSPVFHKWSNIMKKNFALHDYDIFQRTLIGNDVWIGNHVMIKAGVRIGNGAVIGMGAVVTKDVGEYEIWAGNPAKFIRKRFSEERIKALCRTEWWNWSDEMIQKYAEEFNDIDRLLEKI